MQSRERLKLLMVLTVADIRAVGPGVWTGWKGQLLRKLYFETEPMLGGGHTTLTRSERVSRAQDALRDAPRGLDAADLERFIDAALSRLLAADRSRRHRRACQAHARAAKPSAKSLVTHIATDAFRGVTEITCSRRTIRACSR